MFNWKLGTVAGIPINVHGTFWLLPLFVLLTAMPDGSLAMRLAILFSVFGCVLLHELGHAMMARLFGVGTRDITLYPIGGVARLDRMPRSPLAEGAIALAGPAVNLVIAALLVPLLLLASGSIASTFLMSMIYINIALIVFNMLPVFPMDGGRVFRAFLGAFVPYVRATQIAASVGQVLAIGMGVVGLFTDGMLIFIAIFAYFAARAELAMVQREAMAGEPQTAYDSWSDPQPRPQAAKSSTGPARRSYVLLDRNGQKIASY
ncbi:Putative zinc metalloprotease Rip3 [Rosistilla ulvae]|uniref:Zinc metalloprotease Rip3 n=2 Tax=Rosistilla ulvae TaxID=1930277 RepID=A0A517LVR7_9BACT|nr:Putative zinc metalloprotease Rip3 [Rosistilla ulvae]